MAELRHVYLDEIVAHFQHLDDPRSTINQRHPLPSVLVIALLAVLAGAAGPTAIARWAALKEGLLLQALDLPNGVPRKDVFRRALMVLKPDAFRAAFAGWLRSLRDEAVAETGVERPILPIDGKTARRSHDGRNGLGPCTRSACGRARTACRWGRWPATTSRTRSRRSRGCSASWTSRGRS